jgi:multicomponent K+:H+ antiporter subunit G
MLMELAVSVLVLLGAAFALLGSVALVVLPDFHTRLHGPTKATTLGVGATLAASALYFHGAGAAATELLVLLFLFMTAPVSAQLLARAARHLGVPSLAAPPKEGSMGGERSPNRSSAPGSGMPS